MRRWVLVVSFLLVPLGRAASAGEGDDYQKAFSLGQQLYDAHEWEAARVQYMRAYEVRPAPELVFEIALTYQAEGLYRQARIYFERYVADTPPGDPNRDEAERLANVMKRAAEGGARPNPETDGDRLLPLYEDTALDFSDDDSGDDDEGEDADEDEVPAKRHTARILFWTSAAVAAVSATTLIIAADNVNHYEDVLNQAVVDSWDDPDGGLRGDGDACTIADMHTSPDAQRAQDACSSGRSWARTANIMTIGLVASGVASMYFLYTGYLKEEDPDEDDQPGHVQVRPVVGPTGVAVDLSMRF